MANHRGNLTAAILRLGTTRQNLVDLLAKDVGSEKAKQKTREALATVDAELSHLSNEADRESVF